MKMNQAARFAALGEGWVMPMVLMKAFEMKRRSFTGFRWVSGAMVAGIVGYLTESARAVVASYRMRACRSGGRRIHLKMSEQDKEICRWLLQP